MNKQFLFIFQILLFSFFSHADMKLARPSLFQGTLASINELLKPNKLFKREKFHDETFEKRQARKKELEKKIREAKDVLYANTVESLEDMNTELLELQEKFIRPAFDFKAGETSEETLDLRPGELGRSAIVDPYILPGFRMAPKGGASQPLLESDDTSTAGRPPLSEEEKRYSEREFRDIFSSAKTKSYWPSRYRRIFRDIIAVDLLSECLPYLTGSITKDNAYVPDEYKKKILKLVKQAWEVAPDRCLRACSKLVPIDNDVLTLEQLNALEVYDPSEFQYYDKRSKMRPDVEKLLSQLLEGAPIWTIFYESNKLIIDVSEDILNRARVAENFKPFDKYFTLRFKKRVSHGGTVGAILRKEEV